MQKSRPLLHIKVCPPNTQRAFWGLINAGFRPMLLTKYHLKVGAVNFYPTSGKICRDGDALYDATGYDAFLSLLQTEVLAAADEQATATRSISTENE